MNSHNSEVCQFVYDEAEIFSAKNRQNLLIFSSGASITNSVVMQANVLFLGSLVSLGFVVFLVCLVSLVSLGSVVCLVVLMYLVFVGFLVSMVSLVCLLSLVSVGSLVFLVALETLYLNVWDECHLHV
ncbi:hypothetical protein ABVT39_001080, partial [Epinephelus coioides]